MCVNCRSTEMKKVLLSKVGNIYSHTIICHKIIRAEKWGASFLYAFRFVDLPEDAKVTTPTEWELDLLTVGI